VYIGYALTGLLVLRIILEYFQKAENKIIKQFKLAKTYLKRSTSDKGLAKHFIIVKTAYTIFYLSLIVMVASGLFIKFSSDYPNLKSLRSLIKEIHNVGMYVILAFISLHLAGLLIFEIKKIKSAV
jgi:thiosulfate reductase cytochrome b subunit